MTTILKSQLIKRLSRYIKNLSADKITLNLFGNDDNCLENIELDELVLMDLLELPTWLRLISARCDRLTFNVKLANIKTVPIILNLDTVRIVVETCEELRSPSAVQKSKQFSSEKYGFVNKIIDGITVTIKQTYVQLQSPVFRTEIEIFGIVVQSKSPLWKKCPLAETRVKDPKNVHVLLFKEIEWQWLRIEANSMQHLNLAPLKLLTENASCRIIIKKRIADSQILNSRLVFILEALVWILTDSQLKAVVVFIESLIVLIRKSAAQTHKIKAAQKLCILNENKVYEQQYSQQQQQQLNEQTTAAGHSQDLFSIVDIAETSQHFVAKRIDLHFSDESDSRSSYPNLKNGGAFTVNLDRLTIDYYPYHFSCDSYTNWLNADEILIAPLPRTGHRRRNSSSSSSSSTNDFLMKSHVVVRLHNFRIDKVSFSSIHSNKSNIFVCADNSCDNSTSKHIVFQSEFVYHYYPTNVPFLIDPDSLAIVPLPQLLLKIFPVQLVLDFETLLWLNSFIGHIFRDVRQQFKQPSSTAADSDTSNPSIDLYLLSVKVKIDNLQYKLEGEARNLQLQIINLKVTNRCDPLMDPLQPPVGFQAANAAKLTAPIANRTGLFYNYRLEIGRFTCDFEYANGLRLALIRPLIEPDPILVTLLAAANNETDGLLAIVRWTYTKIIRVLINREQFAFLDRFRNDLLRFFDYLKTDLERQPQPQQQPPALQLIFFVSVPQLQCFFDFEHDLNRVDAGTLAATIAAVPDICVPVPSACPLTAYQQQGKLIRMRFVNALLKIDAVEEKAVDTAASIEIATDVINDDSMMRRRQPHLTQSFFCIQLDRVHVCGQLQNQSVFLTIADLVPLVDQTIYLSNYVNSTRNCIVEFDSCPRPTVNTCKPRLELGLEHDTITVHVTHLTAVLSRCWLQKLTDFLAALDTTDTDPVRNVLPLKATLNEILLDLQGHKNDTIRIEQLQIRRDTNGSMVIGSKPHVADESLIGELNRQISELKIRLATALDALSSATTNNHHL